MGTKEGLNPGASARNGVSFTLKSSSSIRTFAFSPPLRHYISKSADMFENKASTRVTPAAPLAGAQTHSPTRARVLLWRCRLSWRTPPFAGHVLLGKQNDAFFVCVRWWGLPVGLVSYLADYPHAAADGRVLCLREERCSTSCWRESRLRRPGSINSSSQHAASTEKTCYFTLIWDAIFKEQ